MVMEYLVEGICLLFTAGRVVQEGIGNGTYRRLLLHRQGLFRQHTGIALREIVEQVCRYK